jgi:hypothetical protein
LIPEIIESESVELVEPGADQVHMNSISDDTLFEVRDPIDRLAAAKRVAGALKAEIEAAGMVQRIGGREHVRVEGWQTLGAMAGVTTRIAWSRPLDDGWEARAEVITADGRIIGSGEGMCTHAERNWIRRDAYALRSMAQTRAVSRALRGVLAFVMTLAGHDTTPAEEMPQASAPESSPAPAPQWARPAESAATANMLVALLRRLGVPEPVKAASAIGQHIFDCCDNQIPTIVHSVLREILDAAAAARSERE